MASSMDFIKSFKGARNTGMGLWDKMLKDAMGIYSGDKSVTELPFWNRMEGQATAGFNEQFDKMIKQIMAQYQAKGIPMPNLNLDDLMAKGSSNLYSNLYDNAYKQATQGGQQGWQNWTGFRNPTIQAAMEQAKIDSQESQAKMSQMGGNIMGGILPTSGGIAGGIQGAKGGGGCCFIMVQGEGELTDSVRFSRDTYMENSKDGGKVKKGYLWMAKRLVPKMIKHKWIQNIVRLFMTRPSSIFCDWFQKRRGGGFVLAPIAIFWLIVWNVIGGNT